MATQRPSKAERLARAYPLLRALPPEERHGIARAAFFSPFVLAVFLSFWILLVPPYFWVALKLLDSEHTKNFKTLKLCFITLLPVFSGVVLLRAFLMPRAITKILAARRHSGG